MNGGGHDPGIAVAAERDVATGGNIEGAMDHGNLRARRLAQAATTCAPP